ncbi:MAG TPA: dienelactone hydrolase family protein [Streptosporangiaceae bacterium]|jgi:carboxymethylenebutenolidase|nr:dienelactone hydrolase family protein [Streptosporangiaceae bacterium]
MTITRRAERVQLPDGGEVPVFAAIPERGSGPGLLLFQEIFGLNEHIKHRAERLAGLGYVTLAPDLYWRLGPDTAIDEAADGALEKAFRLAQRLDMPRAVEDGRAVLDHLRRLPGTGGRAGVFGYCLGGMLAYQVAALSDPDTAVLYYPSGMQNRLDLVERIRCPVLFEFGGADEYLPGDLPDQVRKLLAGRKDAEVRVHPGAGHAFDNERSPRFHHAGAAAAAWAQARDFLARTLPA